MTDTPDIIAVQDHNKDTAGAVVWWRLREHTDFDKLKAAWLAAGHLPQLLPPRTTDLAALKRALGEFSKERQLVRPLQDKDGYALVSETALGDDLHYEVISAVRVLADGTLSQSTKLRGLERSYLQHRSEINSAKIGSWLADLVRHCHAVALRWTGGIYFIPREHMAQFRAWADTFGEATDNTVYEMPALKCDEAVEAILDAVTREAGEEMESLQAEIDGGELGAAALHNREKQCDALREKLQAYSDLLGASLGDIEASLADTKAGVVEAILLAEADE